MTTIYDNTRDVSIAWQNANSGAAAIVAALIAGGHVGQDEDLGELFNDWRNLIFRRTVEGAEEYLTQRQLELGFQAQQVPAEQVQQQYQAQPPQYQAQPQGQPPAPPAANRSCPQCGKALWNNDSANAKREAEGKNAMPRWKCREDKGGCGYHEWK